MSEKSEFGRGLVICLVKFAEHLERSDTLMNPIKLTRGLFSEEDKRYCDKIFDGNKEKYISYVIEMWATGASDHLYEIEIPKKWEGTEIESKVKELQDLGLSMGHGFTAKLWNEKDFFKLMVLTRDIALLIDEKLGLRGDIGEY